MHDAGAVTGGAALTLRPAAAADVPALAQLGARAFTAKFGYLYTAEDLATFLADMHGEARVAHEIADPAMRVMLAFEGNRLAGFCKMVMACGWPEHARGARAVELKQLYTDPDSTGRGHGRVLMDWALATARAWGADEMQLSVWSGNHGAQRFYDRYGFTKIADIEYWVGAQCDEEFLYAMMMG